MNMPGDSEMSCSDAQELFPAYRADQLAAPDREALERHWEGCPDCYKEFRVDTMAVKLADLATIRLIERVIEEGPVED